MGDQAIRLNYQKAMGQADKLTTIGQDIKNMADRDYEETIDGISTAWKGENADSYLSKAKELQGRMNATGQNLIDIADEIRRKARAIYDAEMEALRIAEERKALIGG
ncbi:MAG: hypothetical protein IKI75_12160 [Lachnospiraceae bacterium]|nr:hypothetical protein [Lachnospiraceae bacterium]